MGGLPDVLVQAAAPLGAKCAVGAGQLLHTTSYHKVRVLEPLVALKVAAVVALVRALPAPESAAFAHIFRHPERTKDISGLHRKVYSIYLN